MHFKDIFLVLLIFFLFQGNFNYLRSQDTEQKETTLEIVMNKVVNVGDTVPVKIKKLRDTDTIPKVFFEKSKLPLFALSGDWYRCFIPLSANFKAGEYSVEIFYKDKAKKINLIVNPTKYPIEDLTLTKEVAALRASRIEKVSVAQALSTQSNKKLWLGKFILPSTASKSAVYGVKRRINGTVNPDYFHKGLDFAAPLGSDVKATENGKVILAGLVSKGFVVNGNCVFLDHGHGIISAYLHLSSVVVKEGDLVKKGQIIGKVGSTGITSGPHLHWGMYVLGKTVDPLVWVNTAIE